MTVEKDPNTGKWLIQYRYKDWTGKSHKSTKRCFRTKKEAEEWYRSFLLKQNRSLDMKFSDFAALYMEDMRHRLREHTIIQKEYVLSDKLIPYFGEKKMNEITVADIRAWQNAMIQEGYQPTYLKHIHKGFWKSSVRSCFRCDGESSSKRRRKSFLRWNYLKNMGISDPKNRNDLRREDQQMYVST